MSVPGRNSYQNKKIKRVYLKFQNLQPPFIRDIKTKRLNGGILIFKTCILHSLVSRSRVFIESSTWRFQIKSYSKVLLFARLFSIICNFDEGKIFPPHLSIHLAPNDRQINTNNSKQNNTNNNKQQNNKNSKQYLLLPTSPSISPPMTDK